MKKSNLVPWNYYTKRRGWTLNVILQSRGIETYQQLQAWAARKGVECPLEKDYNLAVKSMEVVKPLKKTPKKSAAKPAKPAAEKPAPAKAKAAAPKPTKKRRVTKAKPASE